MSTAPPTVGIQLGPCDTIRCNWTLSAADAADLEGDVSVAFTPSDHGPNASTAYHPASWLGDPLQVDDGWERTLWLLVAGPQGLLDGNPTVVQTGEWSTWVRVSAGDVRREVRGQLLEVGG